MKNRHSRRDNPAIENLPLDDGLFAAAERVWVAASGGADSTALLRALVARQAELGIVLGVLHVEHGLRGDAARRDAEFVAGLALELHLACEVVAVDTPRAAAERKESIEEAARNLRYGVFRDFLTSGKADKIATAHTLDDQAETVLMKLLRGAWTEGLSGIHPLLRLEGGGVCVRPLLGTTRIQVEAYLQGLGQVWREDETNRSLEYTRNRVRHELLPTLREYNPRISETLARMAANARAEEEHWQAELVRWLPQLLLPGKPVRGGGRSVSTMPAYLLGQEKTPIRSPHIIADSGQAPGHLVTSTALEVARLRGLDAGLRRRVIRAAAEQCGARLDFEATERILEMIAGPRPGSAARDWAGKKLDLSCAVRVERSAREIRFERLTTPLEAGTAAPSECLDGATTGLPVYELPIPGTVDAPAFHSRFSGWVDGDEKMSGQFPSARVRAWGPGDRVELVHTRGPKKVKEVLERMGIHGVERARWPVIEWQGKIVWMRGVEAAPGGTGTAAGSGDPTGTTAHLRVIETSL